MTGIYQHSVDAKGRLFVPARLKEKLGEAFYVTVSSQIHPDTIQKPNVMVKYLTAYSMEEWDAFEKKVSELPTASRRAMRPFFTHAARCELDAQGRILLPQNLRDFAGLKKNVAVVGNGSNMEIWDAETWASVDEMEASADALAEILDKLEF